MLCGISDVRGSQSVSFEATAHCMHCMYVCMISVYAVWKHTHSRYMFTCCSNKKQVSSNLALFTDIVQKEPPPLVDAITESVDG